MLKLSPLGSRASRHSTAACGSMVTLEGHPRRGFLRALAVPMPPRVPNRHQLHPHDRLQEVALLPVLGPVHIVAARARSKTETALADRANAVVLCLSPLIPWCYAPRSSSNHCGAAALSLAAAA